MVDDEVDPDICESLKSNDFEKRGNSIDSLLKRINLIPYTKCGKVRERDACSISEICCYVAPVGNVCRPIRDTKAGDKVWCKGDTELCANV